MGKILVVGVVRVVLLVNRILPSIASAILKGFINLTPLVRFQKLASPFEETVNLLIIDADVDVVIKGTIILSTEHIRSTNRR